MTEWEYTKREQAKREKWTRKINEDMANNPNLIWRSSWGGAPWYDTRDSILRKVLQRKRPSTKRNIRPNPREPKESLAIGITAVVILTLLAGVLVMGGVAAAILAAVFVAGGG